MSKPIEKLPKAVFLVSIALMLCCFGPVIFLFITTGGVVSYLANNKIGLVIFGILLITLIYLLVKLSLNKKGSCSGGKLINERQRHI
jgi:hypothetical protein